MAAAVTLMKVSQAESESETRSLEAAVLAAAREVVSARQELTSERAQRDSSLTTQLAQWIQVTGALEAAQRGRESERAQLQAALADNAQLTRAAIDAREAASDTRAQMHAALARAGKFEDAIAEWSLTETSAQELRVHMEVELATANALAATQGVELTEIKATLASQQVTVAHGQRELQNTREQVATALAARDAALAAASMLRVELDRTESQHRAALEQAGAAQDPLRIEIDLARAAQEALRAELDQARAATERATAELAQAHKTSAQLRTEHEQTRAAQVETLTAQQQSHAELERTKSLLDQVRAVAGDVAQLTSERDEARESLEEMVSVRTGMLDQEKAKGARLREELATARAEIEELSAALERVEQQAVSARLGRNSRPPPPPPDAPAPGTRGAAPSVERERERERERASQVAGQARPSVPPAKPREAGSYTISDVQEEVVFARPNPPKAGSRPGGGR